MYGDAYRTLFWGLFVLGLVVGAAIPACGYAAYKASQHIHIEVK